MGHGVVFDVNEQNFEEQVIDRSKTVPILVDFWAEWCGPCRSLGPQLEKAVEEHRGEILLAKVNSDENPNLAGRYGIQSIPTVLAFVDGKLATGFMGALPYESLRRFVDEVLPKESDKLAHIASEAEKSGRYDESLEKYGEALRKDPTHAKSLIGRMRVLIRLERWDEAEGVYQILPGSVQLDPQAQTLRTRLDLAKSEESEGASLPDLQKELEAQPDNLELRDRLASIYAAQNQYREALDQWLAIVKRDRRFKDDGARKRMLQIFELIDPRSSLAQEYREKLARAIYA